MKPMGLPDPRTGRIPWAVVQLRQDDLAKEHYNLVGFQTKLKVPEQQRIFRKIPGLENAAFVRYGMLHRNTYIHAPAHLDRFWRMRREPRIFFAGQITGVEGYVESAATGLAVGLTIAQLLEGREPVPVPYTTAIGSLARHCSERPPDEDVRADERDVRPDRGHVALAGPGQGRPPAADGGSRARRDRGVEGRESRAKPTSVVTRLATPSACPTPLLGRHRGGAAAPRGRRAPHARLHSRQFDEESGATVFFKAENLQRARRVQVPRRVQQDQGGAGAPELLRGRRLLLGQPRAGRGSRLEAPRREGDDRDARGRAPPPSSPPRAATAPRSSSTTVTAESRDEIGERLVRGTRRPPRPAVRRRR